jgi:hypothetical protein
MRWQMKRRGLLGDEAQGWTWRSRSIAICAWYMERCEGLVYHFPGGGGRVRGYGEWQSPKICDGVSMIEARQMGGRSGVRKRRRLTHPGRDPARRAVGSMSSSAGTERRKANGYM